MGTEYRESKCFSCRKATGVCKCSWAESFTPVEGWNAEPTKIHMTGRVNIDSYLVWTCPQYERGHDKVSLDDGDIKKLACVILEQAVDDWKAIDYGAVEVRYFRNQRVKRSKLMDFFYSEKFDIIVHVALPDYTPEQIRAALKVPKRVWGVKG